MALELVLGALDRCTGALIYADPFLTLEER